MVAATEAGMRNHSVSAQAQEEESMRAIALAIIIVGIDVSQKIRPEDVSSGMHATYGALVLAFIVCLILGV